jgi:hypothetical protein
MLTALLMASCFVMAVLFLLIAWSLQKLSFRRAAAAHRTAAVCCLVSGIVLPLRETAVPVTVLAVATILGATSLHAVRVGRG